MLHRYYTYLDNYPDSNTEDGGVSKSVEKGVFASDIGNKRGDLL